MTIQLESAEHGDNEKQEDSGMTLLADKEVQEDGDNLEMLQAEESFKRLQEHVGVVYNHSIHLIKKIQQVFDPYFLADLSGEPQISSSSNTQGGLKAFLFGSVGLDRILASVYDFGKNVLEDFSSTVAEVYEEIQEAEGNVQQSSTGRACYGSNMKKLVHFICALTRIPCLNMEISRIIFCLAVFKRKSVPTTAQASIRVLATARLLQNVQGSFIKR